MTRLKSMAHPDWPYAGTAHEWRGFVRGECKPLGNPVAVYDIERAWDEIAAVYQKQNFGPKLD
jgi:hypothetical protein